jgi:hypothetical protein
MRPLALIFLFAAASFAQVDGIVTTVTRTVTLAPDEADFIVVVSTTLDTSQQQVQQIFQDAGVQNLTVSGVAAGPNNSAYPPPADSQLFYQIAFITAPAAIKDFAKKLDAMRATLPNGLASLQFSASLNASQTAVEAAHQTALPQLLQDARTKSQALASAAGLKLGAITGITESNYGATPAYIGQWFSVAGFISSAPNATAGTQYTFYASVKFAVQ